MLKRILRSSLLNKEFYRSFISPEKAYVVSRSTTKHANAIT